MPSTAQQSVDTEQDNSVTMPTEENVMVDMRDGARLSTTLYFPEDASSGPWPTIMTRSPYGSEISLALLNISAMTKAGYAVLLQDTRGRFGSEGEHRVLANDVNDGADCVAWIRRQSWSNGKVAGAGSSYVGGTQWMAALAQPEGYITATPIVTASVFDGFGFYARGVPQLDTIFLWHAHTADEENRRLGIDYSNDHPELKSLREAGAQMIDLTFKMFEADPQSEDAAGLMAQLMELAPEINKRATKFLSLPLSTVAEQVATYAPWLRTWLDNLDDANAAVWREIDWSRQREKINIPMLHIAGWHDLFIRGQLKDFEALQKKDNAPFQKLIIGPDSHGSATMPGQSIIGQKVFPRCAALDELLTFFPPEQFDGKLMRRWMEEFLKGQPTGLKEEAPVTIYVQGDNVWRNEWEWPLKRTQWTNFYLKSEGSANSAEGNGMLTLDASDGPAAGMDVFDYDPANPVPSAGGTFLDLGISPGIFDQREIEARDDVLVYTSEPLDTDMEVTGPVAVKLWASTSAVDTDFTAKLVDVEPDGTAYNICDGVTRLRFREDRPGLVKPGEVQSIDIELSPTSYVIKRGHRIRLQVSSSNFPLFDPNPNTGKSLLLDKTNEMIVAHQTVFHDVARPSRLVLPVIPR